MNYLLDPVRLDTILDRNIYVM